MRPTLRLPSFKSSLIALTSLILGVALGAMAMLIAFPFLFAPPPENDAQPTVSITVPQAGTGAAPAATGSAASRATPAAPALRFRFDESAPGRDPIHWANGTGSFMRTDQGWVLRLNGDFKAGPGPNFWLYLNTRAVGEEAAFKADAGRVKLARLRSFEGAQNYLLPAGVDPAQFHTFTIWCESFGVYIASGAIEVAPT
jgi:hypothetical protein